MSTAGGTGSGVTTALPTDDDAAAMGTPAQPGTRMRFARKPRSCAPREALTPTNWFRTRDHAVDRARRLALHFSNFAFTIPITHANDRQFIVMNID